MHLKRALPALATVLLTGLLQAFGALETRSAPRRLGVWLTNSPSPLYYDAARIDRAVAELAAAGFNTLYPNVWSRGTTFHRSRWAPIEPALAETQAAGRQKLDPICRMTEQAHRRGLQVIPWFEYGLMEPATAAVVRDNPEWVLQKRDGSSSVLLHGKAMVFLNPAHPGVRQRFLGLIGEIVQRCKVDGIQLDDHFAWPVELGYDPFTRDLYRQSTGREPPDDHTDRAWMTWRRHQLTGLLRELRRVLKSSGSGSATVSLSPGPFRFAYNTWLQDWEIWALGSLIDELVVQNYAYSLQGFARDLQQPALVKASSWGIPVEIGILSGFGGRTTPMPTLSEKVRLAAQRGHGIIYFYWEGLWGQHAGPEGAETRRTGFNALHRSLLR
ncbi:MAG: glycoside hydrolase family 10 protein [Vulcanococcus sp.]